MDSPDRRLHIYSVVEPGGMLELIGGVTSAPAVIGLVISQAMRNVSQSVVIDLADKKALLVPFKKETATMDVSLGEFLNQIIPGWQSVQSLKELF